MPDEQSKTTVRTAYWWGRRSADPTTIYCSESGWREGEWRQDDSGRWYEASATLRRVVAIEWSGAFTLGDPRTVR